MHVDGLPGSARKQHTAVAQARFILGVRTMAHEKHCAIVMYHRGTHEVYYFHKLASPSICFGGGQRLLPHANLEVDRCGGRRYSRTRQGCSGDGVRVLLSAALCKEKTGAMRVRVTCDLQTRTSRAYPAHPWDALLQLLRQKSSCLCCAGLLLARTAPGGLKEKKSIRRDIFLGRLRPEKMQWEGGRARGCTTSQIPYQRKAKLDLIQTDSQSQNGAQDSIKKSRT